MHAKRIKMLANHLINLALEVINFHHSSESHAGLKYVYKPNVPDKQHHYPQVNRKHEVGSKYQNHEPKYDV